MNPGLIRVIHYSDDTIGIEAEEGTSLFTPKVACEIAASLIHAAREIEPTLDVDAVMKAYYALNNMTEKTVTRTLQ